MYTSRISIFFLKKRKWMKMTAEIKTESVVCVCDIFFLQNWSELIF